VTRIARSVGWTDNFPARPRRPANEKFDDLILDALENNPITSVRRIADMTYITVEKVFYILTNRFGFVSRKCRVVPDLLTKTLREDYLVRSIELLPILIRAK
jgi:hypothetical protein